MVSGGGCESMAEVTPAVCGGSRKGKELKPEKKRTKQISSRREKKKKREGGPDSLDERETSLQTKISYLL